jgi:hypothetical protein
MTDGKVAHGNTTHVLTGKQWAESRVETAMAEIEDVRRRWENRASDYDFANSMKARYLELKTQLEALRRE